MGAGHGDKRRRSVEADGLVAERVEVAEIPARSATQIENRVRRMAFYRIQKRYIVLADVMTSGSFPIGPSRPVIMHDRYLRNLPQVLGVQLSYVSHHESVGSDMG